MLIVLGQSIEVWGALPILSISGQGASGLKPEAFKIPTFLHAVAAPTLDTALWLELPPVQWLLVIQAVCMQATQQPQTRL